MNAPSQSNIALLIGGKGSGKSTLTKELCLRTPQCVVWDLNGEYASLPNARLWTKLQDFREHLVGGGDIQREVFACPAVQFEAWCSWVARTGDMLVVIEELSRYCGSGRPFQKLADLFDRSRHFPIDLVCTAARIAEIPKDVVHQADEVLHAQATLPHDLDFLAKWKSPELAERVRNLQPHRFLRITK